MRIFVSVLVVVMSGFLLVACEQDGPAEKAGEKMDNMNQELQHEADEAGDKMEQQYDKMTEEKN